MTKKMYTTCKLLGLGIKQASLVIAMLIFTLVAHAQNRTVSGKVTDEKGVGIPNISVVASSSKLGVSTDASGNFTISVPNTVKSITLSGIGFETKDVAIGNQSQGLSITLKTQEKALEEVVVVAYGTAKRENFTGSASKISAKEIQNRPLTNVATALIGSGPGIATTTANGQPGSSPAVRIRGFGSVAASNEPLYVVDGVPFGANIANINMDDVESLTVLKDAATTALYGSRAANGVIMITTKKGKKGVNNINVKYNRSVTSRAIPDYERVSAEEYMPLMWEAYRNSLAYRATTPLTIAAANSQASGLTAGQNGIIDLLGYNAFNLPKNQVMTATGQLNSAASLVYNRDDLDWFSPVTRSGIRNEYSANFSGGVDKIDYFLSTAYTKEEGYIKRSDFEKFNARATVNAQMKDWLKIGLNLAYTRSGGNFASTDGSNSIVNPFFFASRMGPIYPVYAYNPLSPGSYVLDANGNRQYDFGNSTIAGLPARPAGAYGGRHTIAENELSKEYFKRNVFNGRTSAEFKITKDLKFTTNFASDITSRFDLSYQNKVIGDGAPSGRSSKDYQTITVNTFNQLLNYNKKISRHNFDVLAGHESFSQNEDYLGGSRQGQIVDNNFEFSNFTTTTNLYSQEDNSTIESYFGNVKYDFANKYFATLGLRRDGNSRFAADRRWGTFWSSSLGWVMSNESFIKEINFINFLKLRTSYGTTGNDAGVGYYAYQTLYTLGRNNGLTPGILQSNLGNDSVTWEKNKQFDIGIDFTVLKNRINGSIEYFHRTSDDLLFNVPLPLSSGFSSILKNVGSMYNKGIEISINADAIKTRNFTWNIGFNATRFKNQVTKLPQTEIISGTKKLMVGKSINDFWLRQWYGVNPTNGAALFRANVGTAADAFVNTKGDTVTPNVNNAKFDYSGTATPNWYGGLTTSFRYKEVTLSALVNWQKGGLTYDDTYAAYMHSGTYGASLHKDMLKRWQNPGDISDIPRMDNAQTTIFGAVSNRWLTDASFLNLQNVTLSYDATNQRFLNKAKIKNARFYIAIENVKMFSKRQGMNPGQSFAGVTSIGYIPARVFNTGISIGL